jgi:hypothetical protein
MIVLLMATQTLSNSSQPLYQKKSEVFSSDLGSEIVLLHPSKGIYFGIQGVGVQLWPLLTEPKSLSDMLSYLAETLPEVPSQAEQEIKGFIEKLFEADLIDVTDVSIP